MFPIDFLDKKPLGKTGEKIPAIGLGTWAIRDYSKARDAFLHAIEIGLNMIDTAEMYDAGRAEEFVGEIIREAGKENVFITTKLLPDHFTDKDEAIRAARFSLRRLGVEIVDLLLIHWPRSFTPIEKQIRALEAIAEEGYARYIGVSNFSLSQLSKAVEAVKKHEIVVDQVKYSVMDKSIEKDLLPYCVKNNITIQAYTPLERGAVAKNKTLREIGKKYEKTAVQIALNYLISRPMVVTIPKTERKDRVKEFRGAMGWRLKEEDLKLLEKKF